MAGGVRRTEVNGIPTFVAPSVDGQYAGGLIFRVGHADESLTNRGITHLVEHLSLSFSDFTKVHSNGLTDCNLTRFHSSGTLDEVVDFLNGSAAALSAMPLDRLETEKSILRTEASRRTWGPAPSLPIWRYGAQGYGLSSFDELGLSRIDAEEVEDWVRRFFVRENAALWLACDEVPASLNLSLPSGRHAEMPAVTSAISSLPASFRGRDGVIVLDGIVPRSSAAQVFASVLEQSLYRVLRRDGGHSYTVAANYEPRDSDMAFLTAMADSLVENQEQMADGFVGVLQDLQSADIPEDDLNAAVAKSRQRMIQPNAETWMLPGMAANELLGHRQWSVGELIAEIDAITVASVHTVAEATWNSALLQAPIDSLEKFGVSLAPASSTASVEGAAVKFVDHPETAVTISDQGIMIAGANGQSTVFWDQAVAIQVFPDGARTIIGADGFQVHVEPTLLGPGSDSLVRTIDFYSPETLRLPQPERDAQDIPRPQNIAASQVGTGDTKEKRPHLWLWISLIFVAANVVGWATDHGIETVQVANAIAVGDCFAGIEMDDSVYDEDRVDCKKPHNAETYATFDLPAGPFPGDSEVESLADVGCNTSFKVFIGRDANSSEFEPYVLFPNRESWKVDDREVLCLVHADDDVTGTLKGANR